MLSENKFTKYLLYAVGEIVLVVIGILIALQINNWNEQHTFGNFGLQILAILGISLVATIGLSMLLARIEHHVKFVPIILIVVLLYTVLKIYHLPGLIFILLFGLFVGHLEKLTRFKWVRKLVTYNPEKEVEMFTVLTIEGTFLIRSLFFLVFGYLLETSELLNPSTALWALGMVAGFFVIRVIQLLLSRLPLKPLLFISPRGLITILLFLYITPEQSIDIVNKSLIIQVIVFTVLIMTFGMMFSGSKKGETEESTEPIDKPPTLADLVESRANTQVSEK